MPQRLCGLCGGRRQGNKFVVRREGRLILGRISVGGRPSNSAGMGTSMGMGMVDGGRFSSFSPSAFTNTSVVGNDVVITA